MNKNIFLVKFIAVTIVFCMLPALCMDKSVSGTGEACNLSVCSQQSSTEVCKQQTGSVFLNCYEQPILLEVDNKRRTAYVKNRDAKFCCESFSDTSEYVRIIPIRMCNKDKTRKSKFFLPYAFFLKPPQYFNYKGTDVPYVVQEDVCLQIAEKIEQEHREKAKELEILRGIVGNNENFQKLNDSLAMLKKETTQNCKQVADAIQELTTLTNSNHKLIDSHATKIINNQQIIYDFLKKSWLVGEMVQVIAPITAALAIAYAINKGATGVAVTEVLASLFAYIVYRMGR